MPQACFSLLSSPRLLALVTSLLMPLSAHADEYAEVNRLLRSGSAADALVRADRYLAGKPRDPQMRFLKGVILFQTGRTAEAEAAYTALVQDHPELPEPYNNLAVLYGAQRQWDKAKEVLERAILANPGYATAHENLGDVYQQLARQSYGRALQLEPASASARAKLTPPAAAAMPASPAANPRSAP
jgi:Flp pilus assembly protein TadD